MGGLGHFAQGMQIPCHPPTAPPSPLTHLQLARRGLARVAVRTASRVHGPNPVPRTCGCHPHVPTAAGRGFSHRQASQQRQPAGRVGAGATRPRCSRAPCAQPDQAAAGDDEGAQHPPPAGLGGRYDRAYAYAYCKGPLGRTATDARPACFGLQRGWPRSRAHRAQPVAAWPGSCHRRPDVQGPKDPPRADSGVHCDQADALWRPAARGLAGALAQQARFLLAELLLEAVNEARAGLLLRPRVNSTAGSSGSLHTKLELGHCATNRIG